MSSQSMIALSKRWDKVRLSDRAILKLLTFLFSLLSLLSLLFLNFVTRQDALLPKAIGLTGVNLLPSCNEGFLELYSQGSVYRLFVPHILMFVLIAAIVLQTAACVFSLVSKKLMRVSGCLSVCVATGLTVFFVVAMLSGSLHAKDLQENRQIFYTLFSFGIGYILTILFSLFSFTTGVLIREETTRMIKKFWFMYLLMLIPIILLLVFSFYPILLQTVLSFKNYKESMGIWGSAWVGLQNFKEIFTDPEMGQIIWNTVYISCLRLVAGLLPPIILALMIYEITQDKLKKSVQTITYIPHFFSWVIIYGIVFAFLSPNGIVNNIIQSYGKKGIDFLTSDKYFVTILIISAIWKELGWSTIIYLAALSSVDTSLYDAAAVDGIGPLKKLWYITIPGIAPVIVFLTILSVGNILKGAGGEQILLFANSAVMDKAKVIDTWVYWEGLGNMQYGLGAAVSFFQSGIGVLMVIGANKLSVKLVGRGLW